MSKYRFVPQIAYTAHGRYITAVLMGQAVDIPKSLLGLPGEGLIEERVNELCGGKVSDYVLVSCDYRLSSTGKIYRLINDHTGKSLALIKLEEMK